MATRCTGAFCAMGEYQTARRASIRHALSTGIPEEIDWAKDEEFALGPSLPIDNVLLILKREPPYGGSLETLALLAFAGPTWPALPRWSAAKRTSST